MKSFLPDFFMERVRHCIEDCYRSTKFWTAKMGDMLQGIWF